MNDSLRDAMCRCFQTFSGAGVLSILMAGSVFLQAMALPAFAEISASSALTPDNAHSAESPMVRVKTSLRNPNVALNKVQNKSDFGLGWKAKPLVDTTPKPVTPTPAPVATAPKVDPAAETFLRPMLPFITSVESNLQIHPNTQQSIQNRLNNLQTVLFGSVLYQDPAECISKIAELYPQEAQKSRQQLLSDLQRKTLTPRNVYAASPSPTKTTIPGIPSSQSSGFSSYKAPFKNKSSADVNSTFPQQPKATPSWFSSKSDSDPFKNDPFFSDSMSSSKARSTDTRTATSSPSSKIGNGLKSLGQGIASLASVAAPVANSYFLNKTFGNNATNINPNTGYPFGVTVDAYGNPVYGSGYPMNGVYNNGYVPYNTLNGTTSFRAPYSNNYYRDPLTGQMIPYSTTGRTPVLRSYPSYPSYPAYPTYSTQTVVTPW